MAEENNGIWVNRDGLFDSSGLIDSIIGDCNESIGELMSGQRLVWCGTMVSITQKLAVLRKGVEDERKQLNEQLTELQKVNDSLVDKLYAIGQKEG